MQQPQTTLRSFDKLMTQGDIKQKIIQALGWDELKYAQFQYDTGLAYLKNYIPEDPQGMDMLSRSRIFWNWWKNHWSIRDEQFIKELNNGYAPSGATVYIGGVFAGRGMEKIINVEDAYLATHDPVELTESIYPNGAVLNESYARMIGNLIKAEV